MRRPLSITLLSHRPILNEDDLWVLENEGHAQRLNGTLRIKKRMTCSPDIFKKDGTILSPLDITTDIPLTTALSPQADESWVILPLMFHSQETYEYLGLNPTQAARLWDFWNSLEPRYRSHDSEEYCFLWHAEEYIRRQAGNPAGRLDNWYGTLQEWGIREDLIESILDPAYAHVRESAKDTVLGVIHDAWTLLLSIREVSDQRDVRRRSLQQAPGVSVETLPGTWAAINDGLRDESALTRETAPGNIVLYRGDLLSNLLSGHRGQPSFVPVRTLDSTSAARISRAQHFETNLVLNTANHFALYNNNICAPADFTSLVPAWHFMPQLEIAKQYARYANRKVPDGVPVVVRFEFPRALFEEKIPPIHYTFSSWESDIWKRFVWHKRNQDFIPRDLKVVIPYSTQLLIGPLTRAHDDTTLYMDSWESIDHRHVYTLGAEGENAGGGDAVSGLEVGIQYVFPMEFAGEPTRLMEEIFAQRKNNFQVCRLRSTGTRSSQ